MKQYNTMITKDYTPDWTVADGIREYIANALDSPAKLEYSISEGEIELKSVGVVLPASVLTLGTSTNRNMKSSVGCHGEGILIGMIPILRDGHSIIIQNGMVDWIPEFEYNEDFGKDVLVIKEVGAGIHRDYTVLISCPHEYIQESVDRCLYLQEDLGEVLEGTRGRILKGVKNKLYVGGIFVTDIRGYEYSFDFKPEYLKLNRDRKTVDTWDLSVETSKLIAEVMQVEEIAELVEKNTNEIQLIANRTNALEVKEKVYKNLTEKYGEDVVVCKYWEDKKDYEKSGYKNVVMLSNNTQYDLVASSPSYTRKLKEITEDLNLPEEDERTPLEMLEQWYEDEADNDCGHWIKFEKLLDLFKQRGVSFDTKADKYPDIPF